MWKPINTGLNGFPLFDKADFTSIGAIAINQNSPRIIWVGTGEGNTRNATFNRGGMYRSQVSAKSGTKIGLAGTERITQMALHPTNPNVADVAALSTL